MPLLQRYLYAQALWPTVLTLFALALLALLTQSLQTLDLVVENRQSAITFLRITLLALPQLVGIILPLAVFMATLYALNRLNADSEIIVAKASGSSPWRISSPFLRLGLMAMVIHLMISLVIQPLSFRQMRADVLKVRTDLAAQLIQPGTFVTPSSGLTVYASDLTVDGKLQDIIIYDARVAENEIMHTAKAGVIQRTPAGLALLLQDGAIQQVLPDDSLDVIEFSDYRVDLSNALTLDARLRLKSSDLFLHELLRPDSNVYLMKSHRIEYAAEGHARLSAPLYNVALIVLALCFMIRGEHQRLGYGRRIVICAILGFMLRLTGFAATSAAETDADLNIIQYAIPLGTTIMGLLFLAGRRKIGRRAARKRRVAYEAGLVRQDMPVSGSG